MLCTSSLTGRIVGCDDVVSRPPGLQQELGGVAAVRRSFTPEASALPCKSCQERNGAAGFHTPGYPRYMLARNRALQYTRVIELRWATGPFRRLETHAPLLTSLRSFHSSPKWLSKAKASKDASDRYPLSQKLAPLLKTSDRLNIVSPGLCGMLAASVGCICPLCAPYSNRILNR
jgi:hypothetical protein